VGITSFAVLGRHRWPGVGAAWFCSLILFTPVLGILQNGPQIAADRYTYLPTLPWALLAGGALARVVLAAKPSIPVVAKLALPAIAVAGLAVLACVQTLTWRSSERLWTHAVSVAPSSIAHYNLGLVLEGQGRWDQAIEHYRLALAIKPDHAEAHYNWALLVAAQSKDDEAIDHYAAALRSRPGFAPAHNNWANVLARRGQWAGAIEHYREALRLRPEYAEAHNNLASALARQARWDEAIDHYRRALEIRPDFDAARDNLARILSETRGAGPPDRNSASPRGRPGS